MLHTADATSDRSGALHHDQLRQRAIHADLEGEVAVNVGSRQIQHRGGAENWLGGGYVELGQTEISPSGVQAYKELETIESHPFAFVVYEVGVGRKHAPGLLLLQGQRPPA